MSGPSVWVVHAPIKIADKVESESAVAIGWYEMGKLNKFTNREDIKEKYREIYTDASEPQVWVSAGMVHRFVNEIRKDDWILTPLKATREVLIGTAIGDYEFDKELISDEYPNVRRVKWLRKVSRDDLTQEFRYSIGGFLTVFTVSGFISEVEALAKGEVVKGTDTGPGEIPEDIPLLYDDIKAKADELISDLLARIDGYSFQGLVAGLLRAMGFKARLGPPGPDSGVDVVAHPDDFGFQLPRIKVQVKHRKGQTGAPEIRGLIGTLAGNENGLFVSTGGFTSEAYREAEKCSKITLIDREQFVNLLLENYDKLEPQYQALVPLRKVHVPVAASK